MLQPDEKSRAACHLGGPSRALSVLHGNEEQNTRDQRPDAVETDSQRPKNPGRPQRGSGLMEPLQRRNRTTRTKRPGR